MIPEDIKNKISAVNYDLDTIGCLLDYGRKKETLPLACRLLENAHEFDGILSQGADDSTKSTFHLFQNEIAPAHYPIKDIIQKVDELKNKWLDLKEEDLNVIPYDYYLRKLRDVLNEQINQLRQDHETHTEKLIKKLLLILLVSAPIMLCIMYAYFKIASRDYGLKADFFAGTNFEKKLFSKVNKQIDFNSRFDMANGLPDDYFSARWYGYLEVPTDGRYTFSVVVDDGVRLFIDKNKIIESWQGNAGAEYSSPDMFLSKGAHVITLEYFEILRDEKLTLMWKREGTNKEIIPSKYFRFR